MKVIEQASESISEIDAQIEASQKKLNNLLEQQRNTKLAIERQRDFIRRLDERRTFLQEAKSIKDIKFSDHALVRYMQRHLGIDMQGLQESILSQMQDQLMEKGELRVPYANGQFVIKGMTVVTFITDEHTDS